MAVFIKMKVMNITNIYSEECKYEEKKSRGKKEMRQRNNNNF